MFGNKGYTIYLVLWNHKLPLQQLQHTEERKRYILSRQHPYNIIKEMVLKSFQVLKSGILQAARCSQTEVGKCRWIQNLLLVGSESQPEAFLNWDGSDIMHKVVLRGRMLVSESAVVTLMKFQDEGIYIVILFSVTDNVNHGSMVSRHDQVIVNQVRGQRWS
jgi:hypothetical protein